MEMESKINEVEKSLNAYVHFYGIVTMRSYLKFCKTSYTFILII